MVNMLSRHNDFPYICSQYKLTESWKISNISKYLKGSALTTYINECFSCTSFLVISRVLKENFLTLSVLTFAKFSNLRLSNKAELLKYFHKKKEIGAQLGLTESLLLEGLTDSLPSDLKPLLTLNTPCSTIEWIHLMNKLVVFLSSGPQPQNKSNSATKFP